MPSIRKAVPADCDSIAPKMREADKAEVYASSGETPLEALRSSFAESPHCFTIEHDGIPIAMFGAGPYRFVEDVGVPWLLGTDDLTNTHSIWFLKNSDHIVNLVAQHYGTLFNIIDVRNDVHKRWLEWCGFSFGKIHADYGPLKLPFQEFWRNKCVT